MFPKLLLPILILVPLAVLALIFLPSSSSLGSPVSPAGRQLTTQNPQPNVSSPVTVSAEYLPTSSSAGFIVFQVSLNTHSVDLDSIDFQKSVVLEKSGQKFSPFEVAVEGSGHHREASVKFNRVTVPFKIVFLETPEVNRQEFEFKELK